MNEKYSTLKVLYSLVNGTAHPTQFACRPTEVISHHHLAWDVILIHLKQLSEEGLLIFTVPSVITITKAGIEAIERLPTFSTSPKNTRIEKVA